MKVLLLNLDRDFEPGQKSPSNEASLIQDLELNTMFEAMALGDEFLFNLAKYVVLSSLTDLEVIRYRQDILKDCLNHSMIAREIYQLSIQAIENKRQQRLGIFGRSPSSIIYGARGMLGMLVGLLQELRKIADEHGGKFISEGFTRFFAMIQQELSDEYLNVIQDHLKEIEFRSGVLLSADLGKGNEGTNYILCKPNPNDRNWVKRVFTKKSPVFSYTIHRRDDAGARTLGELKDTGINRVANAVAQSAEHIDSFFKVLRQELAFYIGCLNLSEQLAQMGEPISFPEPAHAKQRCLSCTGLYDVNLALTMNQKVVGNDLNADNKDLMIITGANQGGKSTFLRSIGLAQLMMQCGMFVPAESLSANLSKDLFTHFKREEDASMESGKFDEELGRMSLIVDEIKPDAMILFNESFAATNEREGSEIARQIVSALLEKRVKVCYVTHLYELANGFYNQRKDKAIFLRAERTSGGRRTFKLIEGKPLQTSYGRDVYKKIFCTEE